MKLSLITDDLNFAVEAERAGIDRVMIDLERKGKAERQSGLSLFLSQHRIESVPRVKSVLRTASLVVRVNPLDRESPDEIDEVIDGGADLIMLPYFHTVGEVRQFIKLVRGRARTILLVETKGAAADLPKILEEDGVDEMHIGLNDLSISFGYQIIFELLSAGIIDRLSAAIDSQGIPFGFGGIARLSQKELPVSPERVLAEQIRLGASRGWLGRTFREQLGAGRRSEVLSHEVNLLRQAIRKWRAATDEQLQQNRKRLLDEVSAWKALTAANEAHRPQDARRPAAELLPQVA